MKTRQTSMNERTELIINALTENTLTRAIAYALANVPGNRLPENAQSFAAIVELAETDRIKALDILSQDLKERDISGGVLL